MAINAERLDPGDVRELHWHVNAHELGYCLAGEGRMGIFSPDGTGSTFALRPGSISFVPAGYPHYFENTGEDVLHVVLTFTHEQPQTVDLSQALPGVPQYLLAETFGVTANDFPFLTARGDRFFVPKPTSLSKSPNGGSAGRRSFLTVHVHVEQVAPKEFPGAGGMARPLSSKDLPRLGGITVFSLHIVPRGITRAPLASRHERVELLHQWPRADRADLSGWRRPDLRDRTGHDRFPPHQLVPLLAN